MTGSAATEYLSHKDRHGVRHLAWDTVVKFSVAFCASEPEAVLTMIDAEEAEDRSRSFLPGHSSYGQFVREGAAARALLREWCGGASERERLMKEIERLQELVRRAAGQLEQAGATRQARSLTRSLETGAPEATAGV